MKTTKTMLIASLAIATIATASAGQFQYKHQLPASIGSAMQVQAPVIDYTITPDELADLNAYFRVFFTKEDWDSTISLNLTSYLDGNVPEGFYKLKNLTSLSFSPTAVNIIVGSKVKQLVNLSDITNLAMSHDVTIHSDTKYLTGLRNIKVSAMGGIIDASGSAEDLVSYDLSDTGLTPPAFLDNATSATITFDEATETLSTGICDRLRASDPKIIITNPVTNFIIMMTSYCGGL
tara:strand:+ start:761 stop:1465 length:705 start_codon:yes stop_codon:yes gene_type:complete